MSYLDLVVRQERGSEHRFAEFVGGWSGHPLLPIPRTYISSVVATRPGRTDVPSRRPVPGAVALSASARMTQANGVVTAKILSGP